MGNAKRTSNVPEPPAVGVVRCAWRTGAANCRLPVCGSALRCQWHQYWVQLVDAGHLDQQQYEAFTEWWEQFQPYGHYGTQHGFWWAALDVLWPVLTGCGDPPVLTRDILHELYLRRAEVDCYRFGRAWTYTGARVYSPLLPRWEAEEWQGKINAHADHVSPLEAQRA